MIADHFFCNLDLEMIGNKIYKSILFGIMGGNWIFLHFCKILSQFFKKIFFAYIIMGVNWFFILFFARFYLNFFCSIKKWSEDRRSWSYCRLLLQEHPDHDLDLIADRRSLLGQVIGIWLPIVKKVIGQFPGWLLVRPLCSPRLLYRPNKSRTTWRHFCVKCLQVVRGKRFSIKSRTTWRYFPVKCLQVVWD